MYKFLPHRCYMSRPSRILLPYDRNNDWCGVKNTKPIHRKCNAISDKSHVNRDKSHAAVYLPRPWNTVKTGYNSVTQIAKEVATTNVNKPWTHAGSILDDLQKRSYTQNRVTFTKVATPVSPNTLSVLCAVGKCDTKQTISRRKLFNQTLVCIILNYDMMMMVIRIIMV
jgi:hypothetical protein